MYKQAVNKHTIHDQLNNSRHATVPHRVSASEYQSAYLMDMSLALSPGLGRRQWANFTGISDILTDQHRASIALTARLGLCGLDSVICVTCHMIHGLLGRHAITGQCSHAITGQCSARLNGDTLPPYRAA